MKKGGLPLPPTFQYLILVTCRACDLKLVMLSSLASKWQVFKVRMTVFQLFYEMKLKTSKLKKSCHFEASIDIMTRFKSQALNIIRIKYWKASGVGNPPILIHVLQKIAIYVLKTKFYILFCKRLYKNLTKSQACLISMDLGDLFLFFLKPEF